MKTGSPLPSLPAMQSLSKGQRRVRPSLYKQLGSTIPWRMFVELFYAWIWFITVLQHFLFINTVLVSVNLSRTANGLFHQSIKLISDNTFRMAQLLIVIKPPSSTVYLFVWGKLMIVKPFLYITQNMFLKSMNPIKFSTREFYREVLWLQFLNCCKKRTSVIQSCVTENSLRFELLYLRREYVCCWCGGITIVTLYLITLKSSLLLACSVHVQGRED